MDFGAFVRDKRMGLDIGLREFCLMADIDASNWSKIERGRIPLKFDEPKLNQIAAILKIEQGGEEYANFIDYAYIASRTIPKAIYTDEEVLSVLPVFFRTVRGEKPSNEDLDRLIDLIKNR
jgi:transcriptional regulator with XRE-family HTH domain